MKRAVCTLCAVVHFVFIAGLAMATDATEQVTELKTK